MKWNKSNLDERQEQKMLQIEHRGCWFAFWALLASMLIQQAFFGIGEWKSIAGEWCVFMALALYLAVSFLKNGIWDRYLKANPKTNLLVSLASAVIFGVIFSVINYLNFQSWEAALATFALLTITLFVTIFGALSLSTAIYRKRLQTLESEDGE